MRRFLIAAIFAAGTATADESLFPKGAELAAQVAKDCAEGCMVLNREQADAMSAELNKIIARKMNEAYQAGKAADAASCKNRI